MTQRKRLFSDETILTTQVAPVPAAPWIRLGNQHNCPVETPIVDRHYDVWTTNVAEADRSAPSPRVLAARLSGGSGLLRVGRSMAVAADNAKEGRVCV